MTLDTGKEYCQLYEFAVMVENSLGRLWLDGHSDCSAKSEWKYYLDEAEQEESVKAQLEEIRRERSELNPEQIKFIDGTVFRMIRTV